MKVLVHLGKRQPDYRGLMREQKDFVVGTHLIPVDRVVIADQTHSNLVHICREEDCGAGFGTHPQIPIVDGLITNIPNQFLLIRTADCTPVIMYDPVKYIVAALHSGRESTRKNIVANAARIMQEHYTCNMKDVKGWIGAGISEEHYEVSQQIYDEFQASLIAQQLTPKTDNPRHLDIRHAIFQQLIRAGLTFRNIDQICDCTYANLEYHSFRREGTNNRQINLVGILDE